MVRGGGLGWVRRTPCPGRDALGRVPSLQGMKHQCCNQLDMRSLALAAWAFTAPQALTRHSMGVERLQSRSWPLQQQATGGHRYSLGSLYCRPRCLHRHKACSNHQQASLQSVPACPGQLQLVSQQGPTTWHALVSCTGHGHTPAEHSRAVEMAALDCWMR